MLCVFLLALCTRRWGGWSFLGGLELKLNLTVLRIGVDQVEILHPVKRGGGSSGNFSLDRVYIWALFQIRLCPRVIIDARAF